MEPWLSWTLAVGIGSGLILYYRGTGKSASRAGPEPSASRRRQEKQPKQSSESASEGTFASSTETVPTSKRKPQKQPQSAPKPKVAAAAVSAPQQQLVEAADDADDDKTWAEQLNAAQRGVNLTAASKAKAGSISKANKKKQRAEASDTAEWPSDNVATNGAASVEASSTNVSDMLEPVAPGPSVLRLTGEEKVKKQAPQKAEVEKETKKQRQNRRKAEEKKAAREQDEQERKQLQENQRRMAREARGEPSRNGVPAPAPAAGAWIKAGGSKRDTSTAQPTSDGQLLDTFDHEALSATSSNEPHTNATTPATTTSSLGAYDQSEEAQMEMVAQLNQNTGWNEVGKAKKGKKKAPVPETESFEPVVKEMPRYSSAATDELVNGGAKAPGLPAKSTKPSNTYDMLSYTAEYAPGAGPRHPQDSDWAA